MFSKKIIQLSFLFIFGFVSFSFIPFEWQKDFETTKKLAKENHKLILLNFSGSDWCVPCIKMHKEIFENPSFEQLADSTLVLYNADFPQKSKNQLPDEIKKQNELLAEKYNKTGAFPFTLLMDENGNVLKSWIGFPKEGISEFEKEINEIYQTKL